MRLRTAQTGEAMYPRQYLADPWLIHHPARGPSADHQYHAICSKLERTRLVLSENDPDHDLLRQINDEPAASQGGHQLADAYLLTPRGPA